jgi:ATP-binding cassette subfamily F protein 3
MTSSKEQYLAQKEAQAAERKRQNALRRTEEEIESLEARLSEIDAEISLPENGTNIGLLTQLTREQEELTAKLEELYEKWGEL